MEDIKIRFGRRLRELRLEKGWSQETLANLAEIFFGAGSFLAITEP